MWAPIHCGKQAGVKHNNSSLFNVLLFHFVDEWYEIVMILAVLCVPEALSQDCAVGVGVLGTQVQ